MKPGDLLRSVCDKTNVWRVNYDNWLGFISYGQFLIFQKNSILNKGYIIVISQYGLCEMHIDDVVKVST
jgi:hypothetical protein